LQKYGWRARVYFLVWAAQEFFAAEPCWGCAVTKKKKSEEEEEESFFAETVSLWSSSKVMGPC
jgi:hypothetical protein